MRLPWLMLLMILAALALGFLTGSAMRGGGCW